ncbi:hypothetical protein [Mucilaginibacter ginkgonis]|uniref:Uncharacterized protein n=1 Tax=Mucilaginibacter ginkgonis TaxID=2682091 RepID=A0A6I4HZV1_9SPHI|nr:hypothetical protein [Mucilaginibacter ginkgonis]QQL50006.1 hypothetical protein GO620_000720 [Mucilaginibacter ginkgonis]
MKQTVKYQIAQSGKKGAVHYEGKDRRTSLDESFGKDKVDRIREAIGFTKVSK